MSRIRDTWRLRSGSPPVLAIVYEGHLALPTCCAIIQWIVLGGIEIAEILHKGVVSMRSYSAAVVSGIVVLVLAGLIGAGCGGSGGPEAPAVGPAPPPVTTQELPCTFFNLDFTTGVVEVLADDDPRIPEQFGQSQLTPQAVTKSCAWSGSALRLNENEIISVSGTPGRFVWKMTIQNQTEETFGARVDGTVTGIEILFYHINFKDSGGSSVNGGGTYGWTALNPVGGLPVYNTGEKLDSGESLEYDAVQFSAPAGATQVGVGVALRADSAYVHVPGVGDAYVTTIAGTGVAGSLTGPIGAVLLRYPRGIVVDNDGDIFVADSGNNRIVKISGGQVSSFAGDGTEDDENDLDYPSGLQRYATSYLVVSEHSDHQISVVTSSGAVYRIAGGSAGGSGSADGDGDTARFYSPIAVDVQGDTIYVSDSGNDSIRTVKYIGRGSRSSPSSYDVDTLVSGLTNLRGVCVDSQGNVFFADYTDDTVSGGPRGTTTASVIVGSAGGGYLNGTGDVAKLNGPWGIDDDGAGNLYIADRNNRRIRIMYLTGTSITTASDWTVGTIAGTGTTGISDGTSANLRYPREVRVDPSGSVFFTGEHYLGRVDRITADVPY